MVIIENTKYTEQNIWLDNLVLLFQKPKIEVNAKIERPKKLNANNLTRSQPKPYTLHSELKGNHNYNSQ